MHISSCSWSTGMSKKIWIRIYFRPVTVDSVEIFCHFAFWRHGTRLASFLIVPKNCIFWGATFELTKNLATLVPEKLQGFYGTLLYHCYSLIALCFPLSLFLFFSLSVLLSFSLSLFLPFSFSHFLCLSHTHTHTQTHTHARAYTHIHTHTNAHIQTHTYIHTYTHTRNTVRL